MVFEAFSYYSQAIIYFRQFILHFKMDHPKAVFNEAQLGNIRRSLLDHALINSYDEPLNIVEFTNGYSNLTYLIETDLDAFVLRRAPKGAVKRGHDMSREFKVLSNLANSSFGKSPKSYYYEDDHSLIGSSFYVMERIEGIVLTLKEAKRQKIKPESFESIFKVWLDTLVELHELDYKACGLEDLGRPKGYVQRQVENWGKQYLKAATMDIPEALKVMKWMSENQVKEYDHTIIHNDYKYDNVVFSNDAWDTINAVLDWEMCTLGDPLMDLGTSLAYWMRPSDGLANMIIPSPTVLDGNIERSDVLEAYAKRSNKSVDQMVFYYAFGLFKIGVIAQQIFYRYHKGLSNNPKFAQLDQACKLFCTMSWQAIQKNRIDNFM